MKHWNLTTLGVCSGLVIFAFHAELHADDTNIEVQLRLLQQQNEAFQSQMRKQQELIENLSREVQDLRQSSAKRDAEVEQLKESGATDQATAGAGIKIGKLQITGEGGVGFFRTGFQGMFPNNEFRVDEAKLFFDAPVWGSAYAFAEVNLTTRETPDVFLNLGELYLDVEDISQLWGCDRQLNLRIGRIDVPFGEEYQRRDVIDNPLISHSLSDIWGIDEGIELYGAFGKFSYAVAGLNGGIPTARDFDSDKSVTGRLSYDPTRWLHLSLSGMRTGDLDAVNDGLSELWFGNGWFRSLGSFATTKFHANLVELDVDFRWRGGYAKTFGGYIHYDDNDPAGNNRRDVYYYSVECIQDITRKLYAGARFSQIFAEDGFPIVGYGSMDRYLFGPLADEMWRLSLGLGYRFSRNFVVKTEYSFERGTEPGGGERDEEDFFAAEAAFRF